MIIETTTRDENWIRGKTWKLFGTLEELQVEYCREWWQEPRGYDVLEAYRRDQR